MFNFIYKFCYVEAAVNGYLMIILLRRYSCNVYFCLCNMLGKRELIPEDAGIKLFLCIESNKIILMQMTM